MIQSLAERLGMDEKESRSFVGSTMKRLGYSQRVEYDDPEPPQEENEDEDDYFSNRRKGREQREIPQGKTGTDGGRGSGWQYED